MKYYKKADNKVIATLSNLPEREWRQITEKEFSQFAGEQEKILKEIENSVDS